MHVGLQVGGLLCTPRPSLPCSLAMPGLPPTPTPGPPLNHQPTATATTPQWRTVKHPLTSVRPFQFASVVLAEQMELDPEDQAGVAGEAPPAGCRGRPVCAY